MVGHMPTLYAHPENVDDMDHDDDDAWAMGAVGTQQPSRTSSYYTRPLPSRTSRNASISAEMRQMPSRSSFTAYSHFVKRYRSSQVGAQDDPRNDPDSHYYQNGLGQLNDAGDSDEETQTSFSAADLSALALEDESSRPESRGEREQWRAMLASVLAGDVLKTEKTRIATVLASATSERDQYHNNLFMGIRAKLHGKSIDDMHKKLTEQRLRTVDVVINDVHKFCLPEYIPTADAMEQVAALLRRLDFVQSLYPSLKAFYADRPICQEPLFTTRRDALITWYTILTSVGHQVARLQRWTGSETLDVNQRNTSAEIPIGPHAGRQNRAGPSEIADGSSFAERVLKEETMQRMFERRFLVTVHAFLVAARSSQLILASLFKEMNLPTFEHALVPLIAFPTQLSQAALRLRLEYVTNLQDPEVMIIDQMTEDLKISIGLACLMKRQYEAFLEPDPDGNWNLPRCISDDYDTTILDSMKVFFKLIHWKLKSGAKGIYFKETDVLEAQWDTFNDVSLTVSRGSCLIGEELCSTTNKLMVRVTRYFDRQVQVPTGEEVRDSRQHRSHTPELEAELQPGGKERMTTEQMVNWYKKILDSVRLRYRKLQRFVRELTHRFSNAAEYELEGVRMDLFIRTLVETGHFLVYTRSYEEDSTYIVASHSLRDRPDAVTRILTEAYNVKEVINEDGSRVVGSKGYLTAEEEDEPQYLLLLTPLSAFLWNGHTEERPDIPKIALDPKDNHVRLIADGPQHRLTLAKEMFTDIFLLEDENGDAVEPEIVMRCETEQLANIPGVNRELRKIVRATTRLAESIINSVHYVRNALDSSDGYQELLENWYSFASDHAQHAQKFMERSNMIRFDRALIKHAISWVSFICDDCDPTDRNTFKWAVNALEFTFGRIKRNIQQLPEDQFQMLRHKVAMCMTLLIHHFDILGARSTIEAKKERERQAAMLKAQVPDVGDSKPILDYDDTAGTRGFWDKVSKELAEIEAIRLEKIEDEHHQALGRVLDSSKLEDRTLVFLASQSSNISIRWQQVKFIGAGAFGSVYSAVNLDNLTVMAVKEIKFQELSGLPNLYAQIKDELSVMEVLHHPNIVEYYGIEVHRDKVYIFEEYCQGGSLGALLEHGRIEDESIIQLYTMQMLDGLAYLHSQGIVHRDIKPDNILLDHRGVIKFVDFGAAKLLAKNQRTMQRTRRGLDNIPPPLPGKMQNSLTGTPMYMSPEVIKNEKRGRHGAMDIWSLGCVVLEFATGKKPWSNLDNEWAIMFHIGVATQLPPLPEPGQLSDLGVAFIKRCLTIDPIRRPTAEELKDDLWLSTLRATWTTYENTEAPADDEHNNSAAGQQAAILHDKEVAEIMCASPLVSSPSSPEEEAP